MVTTPRRLRLGSLFSGLGGLDLAVEEVFNAATLWYAENDPCLEALYQYHWPQAQPLGDITTVDWGRVPRIDVLCGGFPCQDLSSAGGRAGMGPGTRSGLWTVMAQAIQVLNPRWVVIENVTGLLATPANPRPPDLIGECHAPGSLRLSRPGQRGLDSAGPVRRGLGVVLSDLAGMGMDAAWAVLPASAVGAPHQRRRVFILAWPAAAHPTSL